MKNCVHIEIRNASQSELSTKTAHLIPLHSTDLQLLETKFCTFSQTNKIDFLPFEAGNKCASVRYPTDHRVIFLANPESEFWRCV